MRLGSNRIEYHPLGVVGIISQWNYPVNLSLMPVVTGYNALVFCREIESLAERAAAKYGL
jgi:hypothetical protein